MHCSFICHCRKHLWLMFLQCCCYSSCLLCCFIHYCSTGWCCGALLCCEEEIQMSEVILSDNSPQAAEATCTASTSFYEDIVAQKGTIDPTHIELMENIAYGPVQNWLNLYYINFVMQVECIHIVVTTRKKRTEEDLVLVMVCRIPPLEKAQKQGISHYPSSVPFHS